MSGSYWDKITRERMGRRRLLKAGASLSVGAAALALVGCGGDDDDSGGGTSPTSASGGGGGTSPTSTSGSGGGTTPAAGTPKSGGTLHLNTLTADDPANYDLWQAASANISWIVNPFYNQVVRFSETDQGAIAPDLASSWETPDPTTIRFTLNEANYHDGTPFTSADVKASIEAVQNPPEGVVSVRQQQFTSVDSIETPDDRTVVFHMKAPSASFFGTLAQINIGIYAKKDIEADPHWHEQNVNGTGPFTLGQVNQGSKYVANKNPDYFVKGKPYLDSIEWNIIPEDVARFAAYQSGNLDLYWASVTNIADIEKMTDATLLKTAGTAFWRTTVATYKEPWTDDRTWKAVALSVSKQDFNLANYMGQTLIGAMGVPAGSKWSLTEEELLQIPGYNGLGDGQEAEMDARWAEAKKLLEAAGIPEGQKVDLFGRSGSSSFQTHAEVVADGLKHAGLDPTLNLQERGTYDERLTAHDYGDMAANSGSAVFPDPTPVFADTYLDGSARNYQGVVVPEMEDLFVKQEQELDEDKRFQLQNQAQKAYLAVYPPAVHCFTVSLLSFYNYVKDFGVLYGSFYQGRKYDQVWIDKA